MALAALIIAILSAIGAAASAYYARSVAVVERDRRVDEVRDRQAAEAASRRADLRVIVDSTGRYPTVTVVNAGLARATHVNVETLGDEPPELIDGPYDFTLEPGATHDLMLSVFMGMAWKNECRLSWTDGDGHHDEVVQATERR